jgi:hypothetical protein
MAMAALPYIVYVPYYGFANRFFSKGWGDLPSVNDVETFTLDKVTKLEHQAVLDLTIDENGDELGRSGYILKHARCRSPAADFLPAESRDLDIEIVMPAVAKLRGVVIILPGTGDAFYFARRFLYSIPLAAQGFATILPMCPYYGSRKPNGQFTHFLGHMSDLAKLGAALMLEGLCSNWCPSHQ